MLTYKDEIISEKKLDQCPDLIQVVDLVIFVMVLLFQDSKGRKKRKIIKALE